MTALTDSDIFGAPTTEELTLIREHRMRQAATIEPDGSTSPASIEDTPDATLDGEVVAELVTTKAEAPKAEPWPHQTIEFFGEKLEVRKPTQQGMSGIAFALSKHTPPELQANLLPLFVRNHTSPASYARLLVRAVDPETDFPPTVMGDLLNDIIKLRSEDNATLPVKEDETQR